MTTPANLKYTPSHIWVRREGDGNVTVGITHHAQEQLGDLVFVDCPQVGRHLEQGEVCAVVESVKSASDVHAPLSGVVQEINAALADAPEQVNADPYAAWLFRMSATRPEEWAGLLDADQYQKIADAEAD
jgi:glycine cleavage system H protein